jgi:hypothetical protein
MNGPNANTAAERLRRWWLTPQRPGLQRLINPWEYRHLGFSGAARLVGGAVATAAGIICLAYSAWGWAAFFLVIGALNFAGGSWYLSVARSRSAH